MNEIKVLLEKTRRRYDREEEEENDYKLIFYIRLLRR